MKKGCLITIVLVVIIAIGLLIKGKDIMEDIKKDKDPEGYKKRMIENVYGKPLIDGGKIEPMSKWPEILPGKWDMLAVLEYPYGFWVLKADIKFSKNKELDLDIEAKLYNYENSSGRPPTSEDEAKIAAGGGMQGKWEFISDSAFQITSTACDIQAFKGDKDNQTKLCDYLDKKPFGTVDGVGWGMEVKAFAEDTIIIVQQDLRKNSKSHYYFTRINK